MKGKMIKSFITGLALVLGISATNPICASAAWKQDSNGWWNTDGNSYSIGWKQIDGAWYYFTSNGYMQTGWINDNGTWYYTNESGIMHTGFLTLDNKTYYLNESGSMVTGDITLNRIKYSFDGNGQKIGLTTVETTESTNATTENQIVKDETTSGGGGGGSASGSNDSTFASYSDLYGKWTVKSYIKNSGMDTSLSSDQIDLIVGEKFTVTKDKIYHTLYSVSNPTIDENILDNSEFKNKFGIDISNLGIKGDKVNCITISAEGKTGYVIVASNKSVYAIGKGAAFKLAKA